MAIITRKKKETHSIFCWTFLLYLKREHVMLAPISEHKFLQWLFDWLTEWRTDIKLHSSWLLRRFKIDYRRSHATEIIFIACHKHIHTKLTLHNESGDVARIQSPVAPRRVGPDLFNFS